ncbi:MAG: hypothetical protein IPK22_20210 [Verrucomicrobiaceae bacterium]|nr:hypothetical protein [Verrucomicrobiaceae bacterium]
MLSPNTFEHDKLALKPFCEKLEQFAIVDHDFVEGSLVVALTSPFGTGKSTFLRMWKHDLERRRIIKPETPESVILNAWELDYCEDPLFAILATLIKAIPEADAAKLAAVREAAADFANFAISIANSISSKVGVDAIKAGEHAKKKKQDREQKADFLKSFENRSEAYDRLKEALKEAFGSDSPKAFIFVDELDRCRPDYAINYLETIKHVFDIHGLVFVLSIDYDHLQSSARSLFGQDLAFPEYLRKFVQRTFKLPALTPEGYEKLSLFYVERFIEIVGKRDSLIQSERLARRVKELAVGLRMTPRQLQESFRIIGHVTTGDKESRGPLGWCTSSGVILMCLLKVSRPQTYEAIGNGSDDHIGIGELLKGIVSHKVADWWFRIYFTGSFRLESKTSVDPEAILKKLGFFKEGDKFEERTELGEFYQDWARWYSATQSNVGHLWKPHFPRRSFRRAH